MIKLESVSKTFRDGTAAVVDLSLTIPSGKITVIVGPSGCGKTTTLRMINRMLEPTSGRILWDDTPIKSRRKTTLRRQMGYVIQSGGLFPHRTVVENIGTVPGLLHWSKDKISERGLELLRSVGLDRKLAHRYPAQLSGGQQQRVGVARALAADPKVLLMDEPFSAVDPVVRSELHEFFLGLQREISKTIVLITHDIEEAIKLGDQVAILRVGGRLAQVGTPLQLLEEPADAFVEGFVGKDRGYRSLSFLPASALELEKVNVVRDVESAKGTDEPTLVVDGDARPVGWASAERPGQVFPLGSTFNPGSDTLRTALDSALTSLYSLAIGVAPDTGRFAGVVSAQKILEQIAGARVAATGSIPVRDAEAAMRRHGIPVTRDLAKDSEAGEGRGSVKPASSSWLAQPAGEEKQAANAEADDAAARAAVLAEPKPEAEAKSEVEPKPEAESKPEAEEATRGETGAARDAETARRAEPAEGQEADKSDGAAEPAPIAEPSDDNHQTVEPADAAKPSLAVGTEPNADFGAMTPEPVEGREAKEGATSSAGPQSLGDEERGERKRSRLAGSVEPSRSRSAAEDAESAGAHVSDPSNEVLVPRTVQPSGRLDDRTPPGDDQEAQIVTVVSGEPVDLRSADAAARARDHAGADADSTGHMSADGEPTGASVEREPEGNPVR